MRALKSIGSVKISKICPSHIKVHRKENVINVQYWSTHLWHTNEIGMQRLHTEDRSMLAGNYYHTQLSKIQFS